MTKTGATKNKNSIERERLNREAIEKGDSGYIDPDSGYYVFTSAYLYRRGKCCGSGCRHCPWPSPSALKS